MPADSATHPATAPITALMYIVGPWVAAMALILFGYMFSVEGAPVFHYIAFAILLFTPCTTSFGVSVLAVEALKRLVHPSANRARRIFHICFVLGAVVTYLMLGGRILRLINTVDCSTYTVDARDARPRCNNESWLYPI